MNVSFKLSVYSLMELKQTGSKEQSASQSLPLYSRKRRKNNKLIYCRTAKPSTSLGSDNYFSVQLNARNWSIAGSSINAKWHDIKFVKIHWKFIMEIYHNGSYMLTQCVRERDSVMIFLSCTMGQCVCSQLRSLKRLKTCLPGICSKVEISLSEEKECFRTVVKYWSCIFICCFFSFVLLENVCEAYVWGAPSLLHPAQISKFHYTARMLKIRWWLKNQNHTFLGDRFLRIKIFSSTDKNVRGNIKYF